MGPEPALLEVDLEPGLGKLTLAPKVARSEACKVFGAVGDVAELPVDVRGLGLGRRIDVLTMGWCPLVAGGNERSRFELESVVNSSAGDRGPGLTERRGESGGDPGEPLESIVALRERIEGDITAACGTCGEFAIFKLACR